MRGNRQGHLDFTGRPGVRRWIDPLHKPRLQNGPEDPTGHTEQTLCLGAGPHSRALALEETSSGERVQKGCCCRRGFLVTHLVSDEDGDTERKGGKIRGSRRRGSRRVGRRENSDGGTGEEVKRRDWGARGEKRKGKYHGTKRMQKTMYLRNRRGESEQVRSREVGRSWRETNSKIRGQGSREEESGEGCRVGGRVPHRIPVFRDFCCMRAGWKSSVSYPVGLNSKIDHQRQGRGVWVGRRTCDTWCR